MTESIVSHARGQQRILRRTFDGWCSSTNFTRLAGVIQLVECQLPKLDVAGSSPVARSQRQPLATSCLLQALLQAAASSTLPAQSLSGPGSISPPPLVAPPN